MVFTGGIRYCCVRQHWTFETYRRCSMKEETKTYKIVTFSCRGDRYETIKGETEGIRLFDWIHENAPVPVREVTRIASQILTNLLHRELSGSNIMRGYCNPFMFVIGGDGTVSLIDLSDQSNLALGRKIQTKAVMRCFYPPDTGEYGVETSELYGFARTIQFIMAANEKAGSSMSGKDTRRWQLFLDNCAGEGLRRIRDFEHAGKVLKRIGDCGVTAQNDNEAGKPAKDERSSVRFLRLAICSAAVLFLVLSFKTGIDGMEQMREQYDMRYTQMSERIVQLETQVESLEERQKAESSHTR